MNIFFLSRDPTIAAMEHCILHRNKMILEYAQLLATSHRVLDGDGEITVMHKGKNRKWLVHYMDYLDMPIDKSKIFLLKPYFPAATHMNHPSALWARAGDINYMWLYDCWIMLLQSFEEDTGRNHKWSEYKDSLKMPPGNIPAGWTEPLPVMPDEFKVEDVVESYQRYVADKLTKSTFRTTGFQYYLPEWSSYGNLL